MITEEQIQNLIKTALETREKAMAIKSGHGIGAAVLTNKGNIYGGCNIEGVISSLGVCAEMAAMDHAVVHGEYKFMAIVVVDKEIIWPCGACLQYLTQFTQLGDDGVEIIAADETGKYEKKSLKELLPQKYVSKNLEGAF